MDYKIVADSCCDLTEELKEKMDISLVPLTINVDDQIFIDDHTIDIKELLLAMKNSKTAMKTSSPSPADFIKEYEKGDNVFVVTLSSKLSGTYNSAILAKNIVLEDNNKFIHVFDSLSASVAETLISMKISEFIEEGYENLEIVKKVDQFISGMNTFFILESLDNLIKGGRITKVAGGLASILSIKPIMGVDGKGNIRLVEKVRGSKKAFKRLVDIIGEESTDFEDRILAISHSNAIEKAEALKEEIQRKYNFKDIIIVEMGGLSTSYSDDGGIIISY